MWIGAAVFTGSANICAHLSASKSVLFIIGVLKTRLSTSSIVTLQYVTHNITLPPTKYD